MFSKTLLLVCVVPAVLAHNWLQKPAARNGNKAAGNKPCPPSETGYEGVVVAPGANFDAAWTQNHGGEGHWIKIVSAIGAANVEDLTTVGSGGLEYYKEYEKTENSPEAIATLTAPATTGAYLIQYGWSGYRNCVDLNVGGILTGDCEIDCGVEYGGNSECVKGSCVCKVGSKLDEATNVCVDPSQSATVNCVTYCRDALDTCVGDFAIYVDLATCFSQCATFPEGVAGDRVGNTLHCRWHHLHIENGVAAEHCPHSSVEGGGKCEGGKEFMPGLALSVTSVEGSSADDIKSAVEAGLADLDATVTSVAADSTETSFMVVLLFGGDSAADVASSFYSSTEGRAALEMIEAEPSVASLEVNRVTTPAPTPAPTPDPTTYIGGVSALSASWTMSLLSAVILLSVRLM